MQTLYFSDVEVGKRYGVSRATVWRWTQRDRTFPKPVIFSRGCSRWLLDDLEKWEKSKALAA